MSKKNICKKCKQKHYCDKHHVLPKGIFGEGETELLCKNCHFDYHKELGHKYLRKENKQPHEFYFEKYYRWLAGLTIIIIAIIFCLFIF